MERKSSGSGQFLTCHVILIVSIIHASTLESTLCVILCSVEIKVFGYTVSGASQDETEWLFVHAYSMAENEAKVKG